MSQSRTPGWRLKILGKTLTVTEFLCAIALEFTPEICINGMSGGFPKDFKTEDASERLPFSKSTSMVTVPSVALTNELFTCSSLLSAFIASDAQCGQSIS